jgi:hypothetical protein
MNAEQFNTAVLCDLDGEATDLELATLRRPEHVVLWARTVKLLEREAEDAIADAKGRLAGIKPRPGERPTDEYLDTKDDVDRECAQLRSFQARAKRKSDAIADLISAAGVTWLTVGQWITTLVSIEDLLADGKHDSAHALVTSLIDAWEKHEARAAVAS